MRPGTKIRIKSFFNEFKNNFNNMKNGFNKKYLIYPIIVLVFILLIIIMYNLYRSFIYKNPDVPSDYADYNKNTIFSISKIYMFSGADATQNTTNKALWNLNLHQYTDIGLYITPSKTKNPDENTIKKLYINNIKFSDSISGNPSIYYKDVRLFGKFDKIDENLIKDKIDFEILSPDSEIDYSKPQIKSDGSVPLTLSYINYNLKENCIIEDISTPLVYDGSLLQRTNTSLDNLQGNIDFTITIINNLDSKFVCDVSLPLKFENEEKSILDGYFVNEINNPKNYTFYMTN